MLRNGSFYEKQSLLSPSNLEWIATLSAGQKGTLSSNS